MYNDLIQKNAELGRFLFCERYTLQPVKNALYIAEGQDLKRGAVVDVNGVLVGTNSLMPYAVLENDCDTRYGGKQASVFIKGEFNFDKLFFANGLSKEDLDNIVYNGSGLGIVIKPYNYSLDFSPKSNEYENIIPEDASEENKLATYSDVANIQSKVDTIDGKIPSDTTTTNKLVNENGLQTAIDEASESWSTGFTPKGESSVSDLNDLATQSNGDSYIVTDSGTLTDGSLAVVAGDQVAWDATNSAWYKLPQYALKQYGTDEIHNLSQEATSFASGDFIAVSNTTDGTRKMSKDTLLELTAQNALAGNVASEFDPNSTTTVAGLPYVYNGSLYIAKEAYQGPWDASKFYSSDISTITKCRIDLNDTKLWKVGYRSKSTPYAIRYGIKTGFVTDLFPIDPKCVIQFTRQSGVSFRFNICYFDENGTYIDNGGDTTSTIWSFENLLPKHQNAKYVALSLENVSGTTVALSNFANIVSFDGSQSTIFAYTNILVDRTDKKVIIDRVTRPVDLNNMDYWRPYGIGVDGSPDLVNIYDNRLTTIPLELSDESEITYTLKTGVTLTSLRTYAYAADGSFLGYNQNTPNISEVKVSYPTAKYFRFSLFGINGAVVTDGLANIATFDANCLFCIGKNCDSLFENKLNLTIENTAYKRVAITKMNTKTKLPCFSFTFDDCRNDSGIVELFKEKGIRCGFAFIAQDIKFLLKGGEYLDYQNEGFEILNHSIDGHEYTTTYYPTYDSAFHAMLLAKSKLENYGYTINGFVTPSSQMDSSYKSIIGKLNAFGFIYNDSYNDESTPVDDLKRYGLQSHDTATIKSWIDACIANNRFGVMYGHAMDFGVGDWTIEKLEEIVDYVIAKRDAGLCRVGIPTDMVRDYYDL